MGFNSGFKGLSTYFSVEDVTDHSEFFLQAVFSEPLHRTLEVRHVAPNDL